MLKIVQIGNSIPHSWICDPSAEFEPGQIAQLTLIGNQVMATVSDGRAPLGIIDDIKTKAFTASSWDEKVIVPNVPSTLVNNRLVTTSDQTAFLDNPNIIPLSFKSLQLDVQLRARNGALVFPAGTELNLDLNGDGIPDSLSTYVRYLYTVPNIIGDDSTQGSGRMTVWFQRGIFQTDKFETNQLYPLNGNLFVSEKGFITTRQPTDKHPSIGYVTAPPSAVIPTLEFVWL